MNIFHKLTLKTLGKNKVRTLVTVIGIILSAAMFTAVTACVSSLQQFLIEATIEQDGDWHGAIFNIDREQLNELLGDDNVESFSSLQNIGYAALSDSQNENKPYLFIGGMSEGFADRMPVHLTEGRMPEDPSEIILPKHLKTNGGVNFAVGDELALKIGSRSFEEMELDQNNGFIFLQNGEGAETLSLRELRGFTVVGVYERPNFEPYSAPGYTALTVADETSADSYGAYIRLKTPREIGTYLGAKFPEHGSTLNSDYLRFTGNSDERSFNAVLFSLAGILVAIIMFGSISLIYNAFSISVSERTKQFGILSSVGATKKQLMRSVLFEALALSVIGIPLGILAGLAGIGITLKLSENLFKTFMNLGNNVVLRLWVSWEAIAAAALIGLVTVLISAAIPAKRAVKVSAIDAIRQTDDIAIRAKKVRTSKLIYKLFGLEGTLASKNFKRNKRKYRATVVSLFMSVVLFISASSFSAYLTLSAVTLVDDIGFDIGYTLTQEDLEKVSPSELLKKLSEVNGVTESGYSRVENLTASIPAEYVSPDLVDFITAISGQEFLDTKTNELNVSAVVYFVDDATYEKYLTEQSLDRETFMNTDSPKAAALDFVKIYSQDGKYHTFNLFGSEAPETPGITLANINEPEGYYFSGEETAPDMEQLYIFQNENGEELKLTRYEAYEEHPANIGFIGDTAPFSVSANYVGIALMYPYGAADAVLGTAGDADNAVQLSFKTNDHKAAFDKMAGMLEEMNLSTVSLRDFAVGAESNRAIVTVINIFSIGFIVLISLIAAANVFNTISTNISLRRREFAMLKSIGMTPKGFNKMMNFECILYGLKGLVYGIPVSIGVTWLIYQSILNGWQTDFFIPWYSIVIAVSSVFIVVFATMLYSMSRIKKDNPIDALKNENL